MQINPKNDSWRYRFLLVILVVGFIGLAARILDLTVFNRAFLKGQGDARTVRTVPIPAYRGMILDRSGEPLAISSPVDSIWINPQEFKPSSQQFMVLGKLLNVRLKDLAKRLNDNSEQEFIYLKRRVEPALAAKVKQLQLPGVYFQREYRRYYPEGEVTAHVLGFTNVDDKGQEGIELAYNDWLQGVPGLRQVLKDRLGRIVANIAIRREPKPGHDLTLSIDARIQYLAYRELKAGIDKFKASSGSAVVLDIKTGEILAMVNQPSYNPNNRSNAQEGSYRNRAVTDVYEPGSTIKSFSVANGLLSGKYHLHSKIDTTPGWMLVEGKKVQDEHLSGIVDLTTILQRSSNVGVAKITLSVPGQKFWELLRKLGFGQITESGFPGERTGYFPDKPLSRSFDLATLSFGYGMSVTTLQLARAYAILATGGVKLPVTLLKVEQPPTGERVLPEKVARDVLTMLESVVKQGGTATEAQVPGYRVAGKTGTSRMVGAHGYEKKRHNASFIGIAPASNPRLLVAVVLNNPAGELYYGGYTAGPIFAQIMGGSLRLLNILPDQPAE